MFRYRFRLILIGAMFVILFLPMFKHSHLPNWALLFFLFHDSYVELNILTLLHIIPDVLASLSVPILMMLNLILALFPTRGWKTLYRICLLILFLTTWWLTLILNSAGWEIVGLWAVPIVITIAALFEVGFIVKRKLERAEDTNYTV